MKMTYQKYRYRLSVFEKNKGWLIAVGLIWIFLIMQLIGLMTKEPYKNQLDAVTAAGFEQNAEIIMTDDWVGADIWLKQTIHGTDGVDYRYVIKTDCPNWDYETRYMTRTPIAWIDETSAVKVIIKDVQVRYKGTVYASGQYFTVPILGLSSETVTVEEWEEKLVTQAYQAYDLSCKRCQNMRLFLIIMLFTIPVTSLSKLYMIYRKGLEMID